MSLASAFDILDKTQFIKNDVLYGKKINNEKKDNSSD